MGLGYQVLGYQVASSGFDVCGDVLSDEGFALGLLAEL